MTISRPTNIYKFHSDVTYAHQLRPPRHLAIKRYSYGVVRAIMDISGLDISGQKITCPDVTIIALGTARLYIQIS